MVFTCLALSVFSTIDEYEHQAIDILLKMEILVVIWFTLEFSGRYVLIATHARSQQKSINRQRYFVGRMTIYVPYRVLSHPKHSHHIRTNVSYAILCIRNT